jgi:PAS domain S-box-containing protein
MGNEVALIRLTKIARNLSLSVGVLSLITLFGWFTETWGLLNPLGNSVPIQPLTAVQFLLLAGAALGWYSFKLPVTWFKAVLALFLFCNIYILLDKAIGFSFHIDQLFFFNAMKHHPDGSATNGMSPMTAAIFVFTIGSLWLLLQSRAQRLREAINLSVIFVSVVVLISYLYEVPERPAFFLMAPFTAFIFILFSGAILLYQPVEGFAGELFVKPFSRSAARILIPMSVVFPIVLGYLRLQGQWYNVISTELGVTFIILAFTIVSFVATWVVARSYNRHTELATKNRAQANDLETSNEELQALTEELQTANEELLSNVEALAGANRELEMANQTIAKQKDEMLNRVLDSAKEVIWSFDLTGKGENYLSRSAERVFHEPYESLRARPYFWNDHVLPEDEPLKALSQARLEETGQTSADFRISIDAVVRWFNVELKLIKDNSGLPVRLEGVASDITERERAKEKILQERNLLRTLIDNIPSYIFLRDTNRKTILSNRARFELLGSASEADVLGQSLIDHYGESVRDLYEEERTIIATGRSFINREVTLNVKGQEHLFLSTKVPIRDAAGNVVQVLGISHDITELRRQQDQLRQYRQNLEMILKNSADNFVVIDHDAKIVLFNDGFRRFPEEVKGVTPREGMSVYDVLPGDRIEPARQLFNRALKGEGSDVEAKTIINGSARYFSLRYRPVTVEGEIRFVTLSAFDITEKKNQELRLEESRNELEMVFNNSSDLFFLIDTNEKLVLFNNRLQEYCERTMHHSPVVGERWPTVVHPDRVAEYQDYISRAFKGEPVDHKDKVETPEGTLYLNTRVRPILANREVTHVMVSISDITDETNKDEAVQRYRENLQVIFEHTTDNFALMDTEGKIIVMNKPMENYISRFTKATPLPGTSFYDIVAPNRIETVKEVVARVLRGERIQVISESVFEKETVYYDVTYAPVSKNGSITHFTISSTDITEKVIKDREIVRYRQNLEIIFNRTEDVFILLDSDLNVILFNEKALQLNLESFGVPLKAGEPFLNEVPGPQRGLVEQVLNRVLLGEKISLVNELHLLDGQVRQYKISHEPVFKEDRVAFISISAVDITEIKTQERLLEEQRNNLDVIFKTTRDTILLISAEGRIEMFNQAFEKFVEDVSGVKPEIGVDFIDIIPPHRKNKAAGLFHQATQGTASAVEEEFVSASGKTIYHYLRYEPVIVDGKVTQVSMSGVDITAFKEIEAELKKDQYFLDKASESARLGYWTSQPGDGDGKLTWSKEVFNIFGVREEDFNGLTSTFFNLIHPDDRDKVLMSRTIALEQKTALDVDHRIVQPGGAVRWVNEKAQVVQNDKGESMLVGIVQDVNDRKIYESVLRDYNERFDILSRATNDAIWDWDIEKDSETWNHGLETIFGYQQRNIARAREWWSSKIHADDLQRVVDEMNDVFARQAVNWTTEYRYLSADGSYKNVLDRAYVIYRNQKPVRMIGAMQDVSEITNYRLNLEQIIEYRTKQLNEALLKEKELVDLKSKFISVASHEFRTPLTTILLSAGFLRRYKSKLDDEVLEKKVGAIEKQVNHMTALLEDVLFVEKHQNGKMAINLKQHEPSLLKLVAEEAILAKNDGKHALDFQLNGDPRPFASDEKLLRNIIFNLITNAVKFSPQAPHVTMTVNFTAQELILSVKDEGIGIPPDELKNLFSSFSRASNATAIEGTGLGLLIVKSAAEMLDGKVEVQSELNKGTLFTVYLPVL